MQYLTHHKVMAASAAVAVLGVLSFSGYAYATGTDPVSLVKRLVTGNRVQVQYNGRTFEYGAERSYSDRAVTAYAELTTIREDLYFNASNDFTIPRGGVEYVSDPSAKVFHYPWIGTVQSVTADSITVQRSYTVGDKVSQSTDNNQVVTIPRPVMSLFVRGAAAEVSGQEVGKVIEVFQDSYLRHETGSKEAPAPVAHYFVYELTHTLAEIHEADQTRGVATGNTARQGLVETSGGNLSTVCLNNGADRCDIQKLAGEAGQGLYIQMVPDVPVPARFDDPQAMAAYSEALRTTKATKPQAVNNPDCIPFGEAVADASQQPAGIITRNTEGKIVSIKGDVIVIRSSSDGQWTFTVKAGLLDQFAQVWHSPLVVGDRIGATMAGSIYDLDNRSVDNRHIYNLKRY